MPVGIDSLKKKLPKIKNKEVVHQKKRSLISMKNRLCTLEKEHKEGTVSLCFGSKKLFHAQFNLEENGYSSFEEWQKDWKKSRSSEFFG